ncbi:MAG: LamG-like jellyroll fold domain-containing protein [bacterium]|nr:LamG-like jellyroll fold domain-containing protein [bacterium]
MKKQRKKNGFSLVETIVYLAIVAILLTAMVNFNLSLGNNFSKLSAQIDTSSDRRLAMGLIGYLVENSDGLLKDTQGDCSDFDASPPVLALYFDSDDYLPGTCVEDGGGLRVSLSNRRVEITCYPNMKGNGHHQNCNTTTFPAGNVYYLTSPNTVVFDSSLSFATSTATSTINNFTSVTSHLSVSTLSQGQISLSATSTATSTVVMKNEQPSSLVSWWRFEENSGTTPTDYEGSNNLTCTPALTPPVYIAGIVNGSSYGLDFEAINSNLCTPTSPTNPDNLNFSNQFSISAWIKPESLPTEADIVEKETSASNLGYKFWINNSGDVYCRVYDSSASQSTNVSATVVAGSIYHLACVYDYPNNRFQVYVFKKGVGGLATSTSPATVINLVNDAGNFNVSLGTAVFDGIIDELRIYNRALTNQEIWALQSQGDY